MQCVCYNYENLDSNHEKCIMSTINLAEMYSRKSIYSYSVHTLLGFLKSLPEDSCAKHESSKRKQSTTTSIPKPSELPYHDYLAKFDELFQNGFAVENTVANAIMR